MSRPRIPLFRPRIAPGAVGRLASVLDSGYVGEGPLTAEFEADLAALLGVPEVLAVDSCTSALTLALHLAGVRPGDEVISTPMTCAATNGAIIRAGARIVWADVDPATGCIEPTGVWDRISDDTVAVVAVDWAGRRCDYAALTCPADIEGPPFFIRDAAHSLLAEGAGEADYTCYSFGPIKHLTCGGHGGALLCPSSQSERARRLRWHGLDRRNNEDFRGGQRIPEAGYKMHMTDVDAAIGLANLPLAALTVQQHRANAAWYDRVLAGMPGIQLPPPDPGSSYWLYSLLVEDRDSFIAHLATRGVQANAVHRRNDLHPAFGGPLPPGALPGVDHFDARHVAIPVGWWLSGDDRQRVAAAIWEWATARQRVGVPA